jgi:hypothetical protein
MKPNEGMAKALAVGQGLKAKGYLCVEVLDHDVEIEAIGESI